MTMIWPPPYFQDPAKQISPGLNFQPPRSTAAIGNRRLYENILDDLFDLSGSEINGLDIIGNRKIDILRFGWFNSFTQLLVDAVLSERPAVSGQLVRPHEWTIIERALTDASVTGAACILNAGDKTWWEASERVFEWISPADSSHIGWLIIRPYFEGPFNEAQQAIANRAQVLVIDENGGGVSTAQHFLADQLTLGQPVDDPKTISNPIVSTIWEGQSHYESWKDVARELMIRFTLQSRILNRHSSPNMEGPPQRQHNQAATETPQVTGFPYRPGGQFYERDIEDPEYRYLTWDPAGSLEDHHMQRLIEELHVLSHTPPAVFGLPGRGGASAQPASGIAYDRALFPLIARVRRFRRYAQQFLQSMHPSAAIRWPDDPLATWRERVDAEATLVASGIQTAPMAASVLDRNDAPN